MVAGRFFGSVNGSLKSILALSECSSMYGKRNDDQAIANDVGASGGPDHFFPAGHFLFVDSYEVSPNPNCRRLLWHCVRRDDSRTAPIAGSKIANKTPMIAITTSSSTRVKADDRRSAFACR